MRNKVFLIADYFIHKNSKDKKGLTNKKLQKLLYYAQAWNLVLNNGKMFDDNIEAWIHGPAIPRVYLKFKEFGFKDIAKEIGNVDFSNLSNKEKSVLDAVWEIYGKYDGDYLELLTHSEEPWQEARKKSHEYESSNEIISTEKMKEYYGRQIQK